MSDPGNRQQATDWSRLSAQQIHSWILQRSQATGQAYPAVLSQLPPEARYVLERAQQAMALEEPTRQAQAVQMPLLNPAPPLGAPSMSLVGAEQAWVAANHAANAPSPASQLLDPVQNGHMDQQQLQQRQAELIRMRGSQLGYQTAVNGQIRENGTRPGMSRTSSGTVYSNGPRVPLPGSRAPSLPPPARHGGLSQEQVATLNAHNNAQNQARYMQESRQNSWHREQMNLAQQAVPARPFQAVNRPVNDGSIGAARLLRLGDPLSQLLQMKDSYDAVQAFCADLFTERASLKTTFTETGTDQLKTFEIGSAALPRYFYAAKEAGLSSRQINLDGPREAVRMASFGHPVLVVQCARLTVIDTYRNGSVVTKTGRLECQLIQTTSATAMDDIAQSALPILKIESLEVEYTSSTESVLRSALVEQQAEVIKNSRGPAKLYIVPQSPVGTFGVTESELRCMEVAESVGQLQELFHFVQREKLGPMEGLQKLADFYRQAQAWSSQDIVGTPNAVATPSHAQSPAQQAAR
ncbi:uncharacterized protein L969DRAFT_102015 [Mixia osmundae IAM 14324]|uniref:Uncharacterized protein n=1 Tax=Mixia osmundae (strain CBS 9802 / IAM 14324 / JCM 22182 / KY 12970) TaxID=764103 RepID=G7E677_MIXOS|nr:uncharacterized protein L969DRAFT_102015 [Mixia osmundae IAM 14324]KEI40509.1 hypothetical protein L969DRAFT_102015 [Mixia osmundae IAM 14324]GAA98337.1 hypothetical protein E5Q_05022 [Mixia osmundae IAM 14324]